MTDINKYLENQLALAKHRKDNKSNKGVVSKKSQDAAENISKKQNKNFQNVRKNKINSGGAENSRSPTECDTDDGDSDYVLSSDDDCKTGPTSPFSVRTKKNMKKIVDDGNKHIFNQRITKWKENIKNALSGSIDLSNVDYYTADLQYVLDGNADVEDSHELQNGLYIPQYIWKQLYKYQKTGVKWLWELHQVEGGGLLGDEMGLGKTVQIIAFLAGLAKYNSGPWVGLGPTIIVAPATVIYQWVSHFHYWCPNLRIAVLHHSGSHNGNHNQLLRDVQASHGILLITYEGIVKYSKCLLSYKWHYLILDEGHKIRNPETQVSKLVKKFQTPHKILITGSPMQNNLQELWSLFDFMRPGLLGTHKAFMEHFAAPITQGGYANATEFQEATALEIAKALKSMITPYLLRRTKAEVQEHIKLPEKNEQVLFCALTQEQKDLYMGYLTSTMVRSILDKESRYGDPLRARVLIALSTLRKICNHPDIYLYEAHEDGDEVNEETFGHWKRSGKMIVVQSLLKIWQKQGHRTLIFSQSRAMLCILEQHLQSNDYKYLKMDGSVSVSLRQSLIKTFNENKEYLVFLATTRVGGLGVNLTGADRVIIYDPDWNPATDNQAKERAWRIGQERNVTVYRLLSAGTIEEKIYQRQIFKNFLSSKVLIDPNQKNVLTTSTLQGLFTLEEPNFEGDTETASLFKHTKVKINKKLKKEGDKIHLSGSVTYSKKKLEAMKRLAKQISKKISSENVSLTTNEDPRERYKQKRHLLLNPPKIENLPEINLIDDKVTNVPFESALSELDIVNMHVKENYEENLLKEVLNNQDDKTTLEEQQVDNVKIQDTDMADDKEIEVELTQTIAISLPEVEANTNHFENTNTDHIKISNNDHVENINTEHIGNPNTYKRRLSTSPVRDDVIENLVAIKKVKKKKLKHEKDTNDDDYVLKKLFAKSTVKNALHHDVVMGLAEKEKRYRIKEEATKRAKKAVKAIKQSAKINS
ncbi:DNA excision repair protein ERCC-6 [Papilio machaon]|uniref:DNA repair and recombination protein RAD54-like n=1 Tax=Papilio machaon TaxID=76193 RepID=A0A194QXK5_PAPMA|nr:DNA excision repair protein ERCC-6 [Papilio machaon]